MSAARHARRAAAALGAAVALAGCPIPQTVPEYPKGTVTPPRVQMASVTYPDTVVRVPAGCAVKPTFDLHADLVDESLIDVVEARWFVNYDPDNQDRRTPVQTTQVPASDDPLVITRTVPTLTLVPYDFPSLDPNGADGGTVGAFRVVELVVSNGFDDAGDAAALPNRSPEDGFEIQYYRWIFLDVPEAEATIPCPTAG